MNKKINAEEYLDKIGVPSLLRKKYSSLNKERICEYYKHPTQYSDPENSKGMFNAYMECCRKNKDMQIAIARNKNTNPAFVKEMITRYRPSNEAYINVLQNENLQSVMSEVLNEISLSALDNISVFNEKDIDVAPTIFLPKVAIDLINKRTIDNISIMASYGENYIDTLYEDMHKFQKCALCQISAEDAELLLNYELPEGIYTLLATNKRLPDETRNKAYSFGVNIDKISQMTKFMKEDLYRSATETIFNNVINNQNQIDDALLFLCRMTKGKELTTAMQTDLMEKIQHADMEGQVLCIELLRYTNAESVIDSFLEKHHFSKVAANTAIYGNLNFSKYAERKINQALNGFCKEFGAYHRKFNDVYDRQFLVNPKFALHKYSDKTMDKLLKFINEDFIVCDTEIVSSFIQSPYTTKEQLERIKDERAKKIEIPMLKRCKIKTMEYGFSADVYAAFDALFFSKHTLDLSSIYFNNIKTELMDNKEKAICLFKDIIEYCDTMIGSNRFNKQQLLTDKDKLKEVLVQIEHNYEPVTVSDYCTKENALKAKFSSMKNVCDVYLNIDEGVREYIEGREAIASIIKERMEINKSYENNK